RIIDDYSQKMWVYFLRKKSEALANFQTFYQQATRQSGKPLLLLFSDRGGEFVSKKFLAYLKQHGIQQHLTAPYTPQQNGISERYNRTVMEMAHCMLSTTKLEDQFWAEAVQTSSVFTQLGTHEDLAEQDTGR
ncbi:hypothetical protein KI387_037620, partial [Taxus chinensis]